MKNEIQKYESLADKKTCPVQFTYSNAYIKPRGDLPPELSGLLTGFPDELEEAAGLVIKTPKPSIPQFAIMDP